MSRALRFRIFIGFVLAALASLVLGPCAYFGGLWPHRISVAVEGPASWRLVRVDDRVCDDLLPARVSKFLGMVASGRDVSCEVEVSNGVDQARCRFRAMDNGGFITSHQAWPSGVDSLDDSLWLHDDWTLKMQPPVPGHVWFGCETNGRRTLKVDGAESEFTNAHAHSLLADGRFWHRIESGAWDSSFLADAGTVVHVAEWPKSKGAMIRCDNSGFSSGTLAIDGAAPVPLALGNPIEVPGREFELLLEAPDGARARVRLTLLWGDGVNLRVSR